MAGLPEYRESVSLGSGPSPGLKPLDTVTVPKPVDTSSADRAMAGLGQELTNIAEKLSAGEQHTKASEAMASFLDTRDQLTVKYSKDPDYQNAEQNFREELTAKQSELLGTIDDPTLRAQTSLQMQRGLITSGAQVRSAQLTRQAGINIAAADVFEQNALRQVLSAGSEVERKSAIDGYAGEVKRLYDAQWIDAPTAQKRGQEFLAKIDHAEALQLTQRNPAAAVTALRDPEQFPTLDPVKRAGLLVSAEQKLDGDQRAAAASTATFHPERAALMVGRVNSIEQGDAIFDRVIVPVESGGRSDAVSPKNALGASQILPGTARDVAASLGLKDVAALDDDALKARLLSDDRLNRQLGKAYWRQMVTRYDGNLALAAAAYNAGPGRADEWKAAAEQKFGPTYSPAQLASVVSIKETRDYIGKVYAGAGAPMTMRFSSQATAFNAASAVDAEVNQQRAREANVLRVAASTAAATDDPTAIIKAGLEVDPARAATFRATQEAAAAKGDQKAAERLRDLDYAERVGPFVRQAWSVPPADLDRQIRNMEAAVTAPGANPTQQGLDTIKAFKAVRDEQIKTRDAEPVVLGGANGGRYYTLQPIDARAPLDDDLQAALKARDAQAQTAQRVYGGSGSPFTVQEAQSWRERYINATPQERGAILGALATGLSPRTFAAAMPQIVKGEVSAGDQPVLTVAAGLYRTAPAIAQSVLEGQQAMEADKRYVPVGEANALAFRTSKDQYLPAAAFNRASRTDPAGPFAAMQAAIDARYAFLSAQARDTSGVTNEDRVKQAVNDITGGVLYHNGAPVIAPARGMTQANFDGVLWSLTDADLSGARTTGGKAINADYLRGSAKLQSRGDGQYYLQVNRDDANPQYAVTGDGKPFVLDLRNRRPKVSPLPAFTSFEDQAASLTGAP